MSKKSLFRGVVGASALLLIVAVLGYGRYFKVASQSSRGCAEPIEGRFKILGRIDRENHYYTQGLFYKDGQLFEGTGLYGYSALYRVDPNSGRYTRLDQLPAQYFGEGIDWWGEHIFQLSWREGKAFRHDFSGDTERTEIFNYSGEGWGLAMDRKNQEWIHSDGTSVLQIRNAADFSVKRRLAVLRKEKPVDLVNELEWVKGRLWANIWHSDEIIEIDLSSGCVLRVVDFSSLRRDEGIILGDQSDFNGIAYDEKTGEFYLTGKNWSRIFKVNIL